MTLLVNEPLSLTSRWDPFWQVVQIRQKVITIVHQQSVTRRVNRDKVKVVDPEIAWDQLAPRPKRAAERTAQQHRLEQQRQCHQAAARGTDAQVRLPPQAQHTGARSSSVKRPASLHEAAHNPSEHLKRKNGYDVTASQHTPAAKRPAHHSGRRGQQDSKRAHRVALKHHHQSQEQDDQQHLPLKLPKQRGVTRTAETDYTSQEKRIKTRGIVHPLESGKTSVAKRQRPLLMRAVKRQWHDSSPTLEEQKKLRLEVIEFAYHFLKSL